MSLADGPKILTIDIETAPNLAYVWGLWDQNVGINQIEQAGSVICWAAKWRHEKRVEFRSDHHDGHTAMIERAHELMSEADGVVSFNGRNFDMKHLRREFLEQGLGPPAPHKDIDLLLTVRRQFKFPSNKLDYVAQALGLGAKVKHDGFELWRDCMAGDDKAWAQMRKYNIGDVKLTERLYDRILPWIHNHPHYGLYQIDASNEAPNVCQNCGSDRLQRRGWAYTPLGTYQQLRCKGCGKYSRGKRRVNHVDARGVG